jgi:hypothetical protein
MANSKLRFEECARRILQRELGRPVVLNDDGRENGLVDLCVGDVQSPLIAIECTAALDPVRTETWNLGPGRGKLKFDLNHDWFVVIKPQTRVTELHRRLGGLLRNCETVGIDRFAQSDFLLTRQHPSISEALVSLEVDSIHAFREAGSGFVYLTMTGLGGAVDSTGSAVPNWIGDFLRHPKNADVLLKLKRARAKESHVFIGVSFGGVPWQVESYLGTQTDLVPIAPPNLPDPLVGVWIMYGSRGVHWDGAAWKFFDASVPAISDT